MTEGAPVSLSELRARAKVEDLPWLTRMWATVLFHQLENGFVDPLHVHAWAAETEELAQRPEIFRLLTAQEPEQVQTGLRALAQDGLDMQSVGHLTYGWLEDLVDDQLTVAQVVTAIARLLDHHERGTFTLPVGGRGIDLQDFVLLSAFPNRLAAIQAGHSDETLAALQEDVDGWLSSYGHG